MIVVTAGHVDHGKTTLIRALTGTDTDRLPEEKTRGMSINLGFAYHHFTCKVAKGDIQHHTISFVDVPGHTDFTGNMLAGAWSADVAMIVVAADDGIMPQTREHVSALLLLGVKRAVIVISAIDRVSAARIDEVAASMRALLMTTTFQDAPVYSVSAQSGRGIVELLQHLEALAQSAIMSPGDASEYFRFAVDRSFVLKGLGTVVTGTVRSGSVRRDDPLLHSRSGELLRVRSLYLDDSPLDTGIAGQRVALGVTLHHNALHRGDWLMSPALHHPVNQFDALINFAPVAPGSKGSQFFPNINTLLHLHLGAAHHIVTMRALGPRTEGELPRWAQIRCREPMTAHWGDTFILRDASAQTTIAGGSVLDSFAPRRKPDSQTRLATLSALCHSHEDALFELLRISDHGVSLAEFAINRNINPAQMQALHQRLLTRGAQFETLPVRGATPTGAALPKSQPTLLGRQFHNLYRDQVIQTLACQHAGEPNLLGLDESALFAAVRFSGPRLLFNALLHSLAERKEIVRTGTILHLPDHHISQSADELRFMARLRPILLGAGNVAPRVFELMAQLNMDLSTVERLLKSNCRAGKLLQVSRNRYYLPDTILGIAEFTEALASAHPETGFSVTQFRDSTRIGRNLCIEILEYFDAQGLTRRLDNTRVLRTAKENIFNAT